MIVVFQYCIAVHRKLITHAHTHTHTHTQKKKAHTSWSLQLHWNNTPQQAPVSHAQVPNLRQPSATCKRELHSPFQPYSDTIVHYCLPMPKHCPGEETFFFVSFFKNLVLWAKNMHKQWWIKEGYCVLLPSWTSNMLHCFYSTTGINNHLFATVFNTMKKKAWLTIG